MAFKGKNNNNLTTENTDLTQEEQVGVDFLQPKKDAIKDSLNDPYRAEVTQKNAYQYTIKTLNALKIVSPIISALMQRPGVDANNDNLSENFKLLVTEISGIAEKICEKMNIDSQNERNFWIRNTLEKSFSDILRNQWITHGKIDTSAFDSLIDEVIKFSEKTAEENKYEELEEESMLKLGSMRSMLPILEQAQENNLYRNVENDIEPIMTKLFEVSKNAVIKIANEYADEKDRAKLFYMIVQEAGLLYAMAWKAEALRINGIMENHPQEKLKATLDKYKSIGGFPLNKIDQDFDKYFDKMLVITEKLVVSQKGPINKRLKK